MARVDAMTDPSERGGDILRLIFSSVDNKFMVNPASFATEDLDKVFANAATRIQPDASVVGIMGHLIELLPALKLVAHDHGTHDDEAEFAWRLVRVLLAGAGYDNWKPLTRKLCDEWANCPFDPNQPEDEWIADNLTAHSKCGWSAALAWVDWHELSREDTQALDAPVTNWLLTSATLSLIKNIRFNPDTREILIYANGRVVRVSADASTNSINLMEKARIAILRAFGHRRGNKKDGYWATSQALDRALEMLTTDDLIQVKPRALLPTNLLWGPWSRIVRDPSRINGFCSAGLRIEGVWMADNGTVRPWTGSDVDVMGYDFVGAAISHETQQQESKFRAIIPPTYQAAWPSDILTQSFPNIDMRHVRNPEAFKALLDAPIVAAILRDDISMLGLEFPYILFQPASPSPGEDTNQGKSTFSLAYARAINPALTEELRAQNQSAPQTNRSVGEYLLAHGSACLGEFVVPIGNPDHILGQDNLQTLGVGGSLVHGRVYSNDQVSIRLRQSIVLNSKCCTFRPDMINRSIIVWLRELTSANRSNHTVYEDAVSGKTSLEARLGAQAVIDNIPDIVNEIKKFTGTPARDGLRFTWHRAIARMIYFLRTGQHDNGAIDAEVASMHVHQEEHQELAEINGTVEDQRSGGKPTIKVAALFENADPDAVIDLANISSGKNMSGGQLWDNYLASRGLTENNIADLVQELTGVRAKLRRSIASRHLSSDLSRRMPNEGDTWKLPGVHAYHGWYLERMPDRSRQIQVRLKQNVPTTPQP
jgi:hypothetical protein